MSGNKVSVVLSLKHAGNKREIREQRQEVSQCYRRLTAPSNDFMLKLVKLFEDNPHLLKEEIIDVRYNRASKMDFELKSIEIF